MALIGLSAVCLAVSGCGPRVPEDFATQYNTLETQITFSTNQLDSAKKRLNAYKSSSNPAFKEAITKIKAFETLEQEEKKLKLINDTFKGELKKIANSKDVSAEGKFNAKVAELTRQLTEINNRVEDPLIKCRAINEFIGNKAAVIEASKGELAEVKVLAQQAKGVAGVGAKKHPNKAADLESRVKKLNEMIAQEEQCCAVMSANGAELVTAALKSAEAKTKHNEATAFGKDLIAKVGQLDRAYTKTLLDMRADYAVTIGRSSWNNSSDYGEQDYQFPPVMVSPADFLSIVQVGESEIGSDQVSRLGLNAIDQMPSDHDSTEFWVQDFDEKHYHKYLIFENGNKTETDWLPVDEDDFYENIDNLGMDIISKPYGMYEDESIKEAAPPGFANVGDPKYGTWTNTPQGRTWNWLPTYFFYRSLYPGSTIYYNDWDDWNRNYRGRKAYYGRRYDDGSYSYGSGGRITGTAFRSSAWTNEYKLRRQDPGLRGLVERWRGGGPGAGGK